jgi:hypothetical protein
MAMEAKDFLWVYVRILMLNCGHVAMRGYIDAAEHVGSAKAQSCRSGFFDQ